MASLAISVELPDRSIITYDRARRDLILTLKTGSVMSTGFSIPARPNPPSSSSSSSSSSSVGGLDLAEEAPLTPMKRSGTMMKLGWKKMPVVGSESWKKRHIILNESQITYHETETAPPKGTINLSPGVEVRVVQGQEPARKDRFEDNDTSVLSMMSSPIGNMMNLYSGPIGKPNCVECHVPAQVGKMLNTVMSNNPMGLAFGGGMNQVKKAKARTYYFSFNTLEEAESFATAIKNNIQILVKANPLGSNNVKNAGADVRAGNFGAIDNALNQAYAIQANQKLMASPDTSLEWYKTSLNSELPLSVIYEKLIVFYDQLAAVGVNPSY